MYSKMADVLVLSMVSVYCNGKISIYSGVDAVPRILALNLLKIFDNFLFIVLGFMKSNHPLIILSKIQKIVALFLKRT